MTAAPSLRTRAAIVGLILTLIVLQGLWLHQSMRTWSALPDAQTAAARLLEEKLSGPQYFQRPAGTASGDSEQATSHGEIRIDLSDVEQQLPRVIRERRFDAGQAAKLHRLIEELSRPPDSRIVGGTTVDLLRLNLALDEIR